MDTTRLTYFCTVYRTGNVHRAAELLSVTPAAVSKAIKLLEQETGLKLLLPSGRGISITPQGKRLAQLGEPLLNQLQEIPVLVRRGAEARPTLRLGSFEVFTTHFLAALLQGELAQMDVVLHELAPGKLEDSVAEGSIDYGVTYLPIPRDGVEYIKVSTIEMAAFARKNLLSTPFEELPFAVPVAPLQGTPSKVIGLDGWPDHKIKRRIQYRVQLMESAMEVCRQGLAAAYLPRFVVDLHNAKTREPFQLLRFKTSLPKEYTAQPVYLLKRKNDPETTAFRRMAKVLRQLK